MDKCPQSLVSFHQETKTIDLEIISSVDSIDYCAIISIQVDNFNIIYQDVQTFFEQSE